MIGVALAILSSLPAAPPMPAGDSYYVRNDTSRTFTCGLRREPRRIIDRFLLRRGAEFSRVTPGGQGRTLLCDTQPTTQRFRMSPGIRYALVEREGEVLLRRIAAAGQD